MPISPNQGPTGGGSTVVITGTNLASATKVAFGTKSASITANTPTSVTVTSPSGTGPVDVTVTTAGGTSNPLAFYYIGAPFKSSLSQDIGSLAGGNTISIYGTGLSTASSVSFGANAVTPTVISDAELSAVVPTGSGVGTVSVTLTTAGGTNNGLSYTYVDVPTILSLAPASGSFSGGTAVSITGTNLTSTQSVTFDGVDAQSINVLSSTQMWVVTPAHAVGQVDVEVTNLAGSATEVGGYTYLVIPAI